MLLSTLLLALAPAAAPTSALAEDAADVRGAIVAELRAAADEGQAGELEAALARLGPPAIADLFAVLAAGGVPAAWDAAGDLPALDDAARGAVLGALAAMPSAPLLGHLAALAAEPARPAGHVVAGLAVLARAGVANDVPLCVRLASPGAEESGVPRARRQAFEDAVQRMCARDGGTIFALKGEFTSMHPSLLGPTVRCIGASGTPECLGILAGLLDRAPGIDDVLLVEIGRVGATVPRPVDEPVRVHVRYALGSRDENEVVLAVHALGALDDFDAIPRLIALLDEEQARLRAAADAALERMTGRTFRGDARAWQAWYATELEWWSGAAATLRAVESRDPVAALAALRDVSGHRLYRHDLATTVARALDRPEPELVLVACSILQSLRSRAAVPALVAALERPEPEVLAAVVAALRAITGEDHPADPAAWRATVDRETLSSRG